MNLDEHSDEQVLCGFSVNSEEHKDAQVLCGFGVNAEEHKDDQSSSVLFQCEC